MIFQPLGMAKIWENLKQKVTSKATPPPVDLKQSRVERSTG